MNVFNAVLPPFVFLFSIFTQFISSFLFLLHTLTYIHKTTFTKEKIRHRRMEDQEKRAFCTCLFHNEPWEYYCLFCSHYHCARCKCSSPESSRISVARIEGSEIRFSKAQLEDLKKRGIAALQYNRELIQNMDTTIELRTKDYNMLRLQIVNWKEITRDDIGAAAELQARLNQCLQRAHTHTLRALAPRLSRLLDIGSWLDKELGRVLRRAAALKALVQHEKRERLHGVSRARLLEALAVGAEAERLVAAPALDSRLLLSPGSAFPGAWRLCAPVLSCAAEPASAAGRLVVGPFVALALHLPRPALVYAASVSSRGVLAVCYKKRKLLPDYERGGERRVWRITLKCVSLETTDKASLRGCKGPVSVAFYDNRMVLLCHELCMLEGPVEEFMSHPSIDTLTPLKRKGERERERLAPDYRANTSCVDVTRHLYFVNHPAGEIIQYDVDKRIFSSLSCPHGPFHSLVSTFGENAGHEVLCVTRSGNICDVEGECVRDAVAPGVLSSILCSVALIAAPHSPPTPLHKLHFLVTSDSVTSVVVDGTELSPFPAVAHLLYTPSMVRLHSDCFLVYNSVSHTWGVARISIH